MSSEQKTLSPYLAAAEPHDTARRYYEFVRDEIAHSVDIGAERVTCRASEPLR